MKIWVFSIGENTTQLCCDLLKEYGFEVILIEDQSKLWDKLKRFYEEALQTNDTEFMRIDADIIPNSSIKDFTNVNGWTCAEGFDWYKQDMGAISIHIMSRALVVKCLQNIDSAKDKNRPESHLWRIEDINLNVEISVDGCFGIHGYAQSNQRERIKELKQSRNQEYNWCLLDRIEDL